MGCTVIWDDVRLHLLHHPERTVREIADVLGLRPDSVRTVLHIAHARGLANASNNTPATWWLGMGERPTARTPMPRFALGQLQVAVLETLRSADVPLSTAQISRALQLKPNPALQLTPARAGVVLRRLAARPDACIQRVQAKPRAAVRWRVVA